jgi:predicted DNA-binding WGR domain protein
MTRRFEKPGGRTLFWEARLQDRFVCLIWGEVGGARKQLDRNCGTPAAAAAKFEELIAKQRADGYVEVEQPVAFDPREITNVLVAEMPPPSSEDERDAPAPSVLAFASSPELELQCEQAPDDVAPWEIYGDWLISKGDLRGEIAALRRAHKDRDANRMLAIHYDALFGAHARDLKDIVRDLEWKHGFVRHAVIHLRDPDSSGMPFADYVRTFLASPIARFIDSLQLGLAGQSRNNWGPTLRAIADSPQAPFLRVLRFDAEKSYEVSWIALGDLDGWTAFPHLEVLRFRAGGGGTLGTLALPALEIFEYESCGITKREIDTIAAAPWPKLERLVLWLGARDRDAIETVSPLRPILDGRQLPVLSHLGFPNSELIEDLIPMLAESPLLLQLRSLDLSKSTLVSSVALVKHAAAFRHLDSISLEQNLLSDDHCEAIRAVLPNARLDDQRFDELENEGVAEDDLPRYVALWE